MNEVFCTFEIATILKKIGFDVPCYGHWFIGKDKTFNCAVSPMNWNSMKTDLDWVSCPTYDMICRWIREKYQKHCSISYDYTLNWYFQVIDLRQTVEYDYSEMKIYHSDNETNFKSYEEALESCIKFCLNNVIKKNYD